MFSDDFYFFDLTPSIEVPYDPSKEIFINDIDNLNFNINMPKEYIRLNTEMLQLSKRYMSMVNSSPYMDYIWPLAISNVEYGYYSKSKNDKWMLTNWVVDIEQFKSNPDYLIQFNWKEAKRLNPSIVTARSGGAIGVFQCERGFGAWANPILESDFGSIGTTNGLNRTDCWTELGENPNGIGNIVWKLGMRADRWSYADSLNIIAGVLQQDCKSMSDKMLFNLMPDKYGMVTYLMWAHNTGNGILKNYDYANKVLEVISHKDEINNLITKYKPYKFLYQNYFDEIANKYNLPKYPTRALASYLIIERRINGEW